MKRWKSWQGRQAWKSWKSWVSAAVLGTGVFAAAAALLPGRSEACGGLFCSSAQPVNQAAERIIFSFDDVKKEVTAVVEILYSGPSEKFAWVLPVPGVPKVEVSTSAVLDRLQSQTNPLYSINRVWPESTCGRGGSTNAGSASPPSGSSPGANENGGVSVLASGSVGPYVYDVIMVDPNPAITDKAMVALEWLMKNGYDVGIGREVLQPYLRDGLNLIAFRLQKNTPSGSIRPVMLTYAAQHPMIPIIPTKVAANNDMGILVFVLGARRAVTTNYKSLELNEALIDWFNPNTTYNAVVTAAADEAKGQGFVTEMATPTAARNFASTLYQEQGIVTDFRRRADSLTNVELVTTVIERFATNTPGGFMGPFATRPAGGRVFLDGVTDVFAKHIVLPAGADLADFMSRPLCYLVAAPPSSVYCSGKIAPPADHHVDISQLDRRKFILDLEDLVIKPIEATAKLFADQPYLTRLYTTLSPAEMTVDPTFDLLTGLPDVSNNHSITMSYSSKSCGDVDGAWSAEVGGLIVRGTGGTWPHDLKAATMPFNRRILQMTAQRAPVVETDNTMVIAKALGGEQPANPMVPGGITGGSMTSPGGDSGGCSISLGSGASGGSTQGSLGWLALAGALGLLIRRRRQN
jgi:hypothetical protein